MNKPRLIFYSTILAALVGAFIFRGTISEYFSPKLGNIEQVAIKAAVENIKKTVATPEPLRAPTSSEPSVSPAKTSASDSLTVAGVISWTNIQRQENGALPALAENSQLDTIAEERLADMFQKQYFAHVSPSGDSVTTVAASVGYDYLELGENLALGNFGGDEKVVIAWMNSPGHRANILNVNYREIGVAVRKGVYEGESTWIAVQIFGKPVSACPAIDSPLKDRITASESQLTSMESQISILKSQLDTMDKSDRRAYNATVDEYNALVAQYNDLVAQTKQMISQYNTEVSAFNQCVSG
ncbi:MAG: hypothetical protein KGJ89_02665 [Patescibacteria group bacterium]|nr:hypothetical protein [Patescibacteria group bacterium]MDE2015781.1 hypothetical protein [Patescibacteria group bacterium]MDE2226838.1 hypothetical protein [Patescibacteria group bacterium]